MITRAAPRDTETIPSPSPRKPATVQASLPRLAAIDIGTNSIRLVVAEVQADASYRVLDEDREMTRLGRGLYRDGRRGDAPVEQSLQALGPIRPIAPPFRVTYLP